MTTREGTMHPTTPELVSARQGELLQSARNHQAARTTRRRRRTDRQAPVPRYPPTESAPAATEPMDQRCTIDLLGHPAESSFATAWRVNERLARFEVAAIESDLVPFLAAAAAELAFGAGIAWRLSTDDPAVALLRLIAKVAITSPDIGGPHTTRLFEQLD